MEIKPIKAPAFQFYVQDFLHGTRQLTTLEIGAYILLLCEQWDKGFIINDEKALKKLTRLSFKKLENVLMKFDCIDDKLINARLEKARSAKVKFIEQCSQKGIEGNKKRWGDKIQTELPLQTKQTHTGNFFYIGTELYKSPVSKYVLAEFQIMLDPWEIKNKEFTIQQVLNEMDSRYFGYNFTSINHVRNSFGSTYKEMVKDKNYANKYKQTAPGTEKSAISFGARK